MRLLVTGNTGQVVSALVANGAAAGVDVVTLGRPTLDLARPGTITPDLIGRLRPDVVVNAAAYTAVDQAESDFAEAMTVNGTGAGAVAAAAHIVGVPVIQLSTDYVFDGTGTRPWRETDPVGPINAYGRTKLAGERAVAEANPDHVILRTSWVYDSAGKNFLRTMLRLATTRTELSVVGDQHGAPSYAPDIADAIIAIARNLLAQPANADMRGTFHMAGGGFTTWADFARDIFRLSAAAGGPSARVAAIPTTDYPTPARRPANSRLDCARLFQAHGVALPHWQDGLIRCMRRVAPGLEKQS